MSLEDWEFQETPWWDPHYRVIKFAAKRAGVRHVFAISQEAINDYFGTEDTEEAAFRNYYENLERVHLLAVQLVSVGVQNDEGVFFITSEMCYKYLP